MAGVINNNNSMVLTAQLHLQKPSQIQQHLQQNIKLSNNQTNQQQVISHNDEAGPAARIIIPPQQYANRYVWENCMEFDADLIFSSTATAKWQQQQWQRRNNCIDWQ